MLVLYACPYTVSVFNEIRLSKHLRNGEGERRKVGDGGDGRGWQTRKHKHQRQYSNHSNPIYSRFIHFDKGESYMPYTPHIHSPRFDMYIQTHIFGMLTHSTYDAAFSDMRPYLCAHVCVCVYLYIVRQSTHNLNGFISLACPPRANFDFLATLSANSPNAFEL